VSFGTVVYRFTVARPEGKRPLGRPTLRCEINNMANILVVGFEVLDWIEVAPDKYM
jgi:hypothetical protein